MQPNQTSSFMKCLLAYGASEVASKLSRLFVVVAVARSLGPEQVGLAAAALGICELIKALTENGINQRVMAAADTNLESTCAQAHRLNWAWCLMLCVLQVLVASVLWQLGQGVVALLVGVAAIEYLFMPGGLVQAALAMREGKLTQTAAISGAQIVGANALAVVLAILAPSPLALILPRVLTAPFWLIAMRRLRPWTAQANSKLAPKRPFITYGIPVLGIELVKALRLHADKLIVGALLGADALGLYFMAFNAGLSLATSFVAAFEKVVFPHLCGLCRGQSVSLRLTRKLALLGLMIITPFIAVQSLFAPVYVPLLLGDGWTGVAPVVSVLCLCALPLTVWTVVAAQLRLSNKPEVEFAVTLALTIGLSLGAIVCAPLGLMPMALAYLGITTIVLSIASAPMLFRPAPAIQTEV